MPDAMIAHNAPWSDLRDKTPELGSSLIAVATGVEPEDSVQLAVPH